MDREEVELIKKHAEKIYAGDCDNYDGADAARIIKKLCDALLTFMNEQI